MFSVKSLTSAEARVIAEAYLKSGRNPNKMSEVLGMLDFDKDLLAHPLVRREVVAIARINAATYTMEDHISMLAEIRDKALADSKFSAALGAELSIGKARGLYDKNRTEENEDDPAFEPQKMTTDQIRRALRERENYETKTLPAPEGNELEETSDALDIPDTFMEDGVK